MHTTQFTVEIAEILSHTTYFHKKFVKATVLRVLGKYTDPTDHTPHTQTIYFSFIL